LVDRLTAPMARKTGRISQLRAAQMASIRFRLRVQSGIAKRHRVTY
jgi:hypothetical protein